MTARYFQPLCTAYVFGEGHVIEADANLVSGERKQKVLDRGREVRSTHISASEVSRRITIYVSCVMRHFIRIVGRCRRR